MARINSWVFEDIDVSTPPSVTKVVTGDDEPIVPPLDTQGSQNADSNAPKDGSLFEGDNVIGTQTNIDLPDAPHVDIVTNATNLHVPDTIKKEEIISTPDEENNEPKYTPPPAPELSKTEEEPSNTEVDELSDNNTVLESDINVPDMDDGDDDLDDIDDEDDDDGDNEKVSPDDEKVESTESDVDAASDEDEQIDDTKDKLEDDKRELEELKEVATESLSSGGLSPVAFNIMQNRVQRIATEWAVELPSSIAVESNATASQRFTDTSQLITNTAIAMEGLTSRITNWISAKYESAGKYLSTAGSFGKSGVVDADRKIAKIKSLLADWESEDIKCTDNMLKMLTITEPLKVAGLAKGFIDLDIEKMAAAVDSKHVDACRGVDGKGSFKVNKQDIINSYVDGDDVVAVWVGADVYVAEYLDKSFNCRMGKTVETGITSDLKVAKGVNKTELLAIAQTYRSLCELVVTRLGPTLKLSETLASSDKEIENINSTTTEAEFGKYLLQSSLKASIITAYYKAIVKTARALKDALNTYLSKPKAIIIGTEGFDYHVTQVLESRTKVPEQSTYAYSIKKAIKATLLNPTWWNGVECTGLPITDHVIVNALSNGKTVMSPADVLGQFKKVIAFDADACKALTDVTEAMKPIVDGTLDRYFSAAERGDLVSMKEALESGSAAISKIKNPMMQNYRKGIILNSSTVINVTDDGFKPAKHTAITESISPLSKKDIIELGKYIMTCNGSALWEKNEELAGNRYLRTFKEIDEIHNKFTGSNSSNITSEQAIDGYIGHYRYEGYQCAEIESTVDSYPSHIASLINAAIRNK